MSQMLEAGPGRFFGAIRAVATVREGAEIVVFLCEVNNARFQRFPVGLILRHFDMTTSIGDAVKTFGTEFKFYHKESFFRKNAKIAKKISRTCDFRPS